MKSFLSFFVIVCMVTSYLPAYSDPLTDSLKQIRDALSDPETGLRATSFKMHREHTSNYLGLLQADMTFFSYLFSSYKVAIRNHHGLLKAQLTKIKAERESILSDKATSSNKKIKPLHELAEAATRLESDGAKLARWEDSLERAKNALIEVIEQPCAPSRLKIVKQALNANAYLKRRSVGVDNFQNDVQEMFKDLQGIQLEAAGFLNQLSDLQKYARDNKRPPFYASFSYGTEGIQASDGQAATGILSVVGSAALIQAGTAGMSAATSAMLMTVGTVCIAIAVVAVLVAVGTYIAACIQRVNARRDQMDIVREINRLIEGAVPTRSESDSIIDESCKSIKSNQVIDQSLKELKQADVRVDWALFAGTSDSFWNSFEEVRKTVAPPEAKEIEKSLRTALQNARSRFGFEHVFRQRAFETVKIQKFASSPDEFLNLENSSERRALRLILEETQIQGERRRQLEEILK